MLQARPRTEAPGGVPRAPATRDIQEESAVPKSGKYGPLLKVSAHAAAVCTYAPKGAITFTEHAPPGASVERARFV